MSCAWLGVERLQGATRSGVLILRETGNVNVEEWQDTVAGSMRMTRTAATCWIIWFEETAAFATNHFDTPSIRPHDVVSKPIHCHVIVQAVCASCQSNCRLIHLLGIVGVALLLRRDFCSAFCCCCLLVRWLLLWITIIKESRKLLLRSDDEVVLAFSYRLLYGERIVLF